jgi:hypothetical protein
MCYTSLVVSRFLYIFLLLTTQCYRLRKIKIKDIYFASWLWPRPRDCVLWWLSFWAMSCACTENHMQWQGLGQGNSIQLNQQPPSSVRPSLSLPFLSSHPGFHTSVIHPVFLLVLWIHFHIACVCVCVCVCV